MIPGLDNREYMAGLLKSVFQDLPDRLSTKVKERVSSLPRAVRGNLEGVVKFETASNSDSTNSQYSLELKVNSSEEGFEFSSHSTTGGGDLAVRIDYHLVEQKQRRGWMFWRMPEEGPSKSYQLTMRVKIISAIFPLQKVSPFDVTYGEVQGIIREYEQALTKAGEVPVRWIFSAAKSP